MSEQEIIELLDALHAGADAADARTFAEGLLLGFLSTKGYGEIVTAYLLARQRVQW